MEELYIEVPNGMPTHEYEAFGATGLIYALNCVPLVEKKGLAMWRPSFESLGSGAQIWNAGSGEVLLDASEVDGKACCLVKTATEIKVVEVDPAGSTIGALPFSFPLAEDGNIGALGTGAVVGLEGKGVFFLKKESGAWTEAFRIGALAWGSFQNATESQIQGDASSSPYTDLVQIQWGDPDLGAFKSWLSRIILYVAADPNTTGFEWTLEIEDGDGLRYEADETYREFSMPVHLGQGRTVWTPLTFTFMKAFKLPITVRLKFKNGAGSLFVEGSSRTFNGVGAQATWLTASPIHMLVGGSLCPDRAFIGTHRGSLFGLYGELALQVASVIDLEFQEEVALESEPIRMVSFLDGAYLFCKERILALQGWSFKGLNVQTLSPFGIKDKWKVAPTNQGIAFLYEERLFILAGGIQELNYAVREAYQNYPIYLSYYASMGIIFIAYENMSLFRAFFERTNTSVLWRADEASNEVPITEKAGVIIMTDGRAYKLNRSAGEAQQYAVALFVGSEVIPKGRRLLVEFLEVDGQLYWAREFSLKATSYGDWIVMNGSALLPDFAQDFITYSNAWYQGGDGLRVGVSDGGALDSRKRVPSAFPSIDAESEGVIEQVRTLHGRKFIVGLELGASAPKHPANEIYGFRLFGEISGDYFSYKFQAPPPV